MRLDLLSCALASIVSAQTLETVLTKNDAHAPEVQVHGLSAKVQQALDELKAIESASVSPQSSRSKSILEYIGSSLFSRLRPVALSTQSQDVYKSPTDKLEEAASEGNNDAIFLLGELSFHGNYSYPRSYRNATRYYTYLAESTGNMTALENLAILHSAGLQGMKTDQGLALLYHTFAADQGSMRSQMALGFRHLNGIGVTPDCTAACEYYAKAAQAAIEWVHSGPPGGMYWSKRAYHYAEDVGGLYGSAPVFKLKASGATDPKELNDVIDYYTYMAEKSDIQASFALAKLYNDGTKTVEQDFVKSLYWFRQVAKSYWTKDGRTVKNVKPMQYHAKSAAFIATAYLRGEGTDQDFDKAKIWFQRGIALGDPTAQNGFALMHLLGLGPVQRDVTKAEELFKAAADNDHKGAQVNLGKILAARGDLVSAARQFESAARVGRSEAFYYLAQFFHHGVGREKDCAMATRYYKIVVESVETLHSTIPFGNQAYFDGRIEDAVIANLIAAESGYEIGQLNVAFLLDKHRRAFSLADIVRSIVVPAFSRLKRLMGPLRMADSTSQPKSAYTISDELALRYYTRSAAQQNLIALVKAGDFHLKGFGTVPNPEKAVSLWTTAADSRMVPQALWNLGWSYENGIGVEQDFHLAKRYYDACLEVDKRAYFPVSLSLLKLRLRSAWNTITGGSINSIRDEESKQTPVTWSSIFTGIKHFWRSQFESTDLGAQPGGDNAAAGAFIDEDYPVVDDNFFDTMFILGACFAVLGIVYMRTTWWPQQTRRNHGAGARDGQDPPIPNVAEWIVR